MRPQTLLGRYPSTGRAGAAVRRVRGTDAHDLVGKYEAEGAGQHPKTAAPRCGGTARCVFSRLFCSHSRICPLFAPLTSMRVYAHMYHSGRQRSTSPECPSSRFGAANRVLRPSPPAPGPVTDRGPLDAGGPQAGRTRRAGRRAHLCRSRRLNCSREYTLFKRKIPRCVPPFKRACRRVRRR